MNRNSRQMDHLQIPRSGNHPITELSTHLTTTGKYVVDENLTRCKRQWACCCKNNVRLSEESWKPSSYNMWRTKIQMSTVNVRTPFPTYSVPASAPPTTRVCLDIVCDRISISLDFDYTTSYRVDYRYRNSLRHCSIVLDDESMNFAWRAFVGVFLHLIAKGLVWLFMSLASEV